MARNASNNLLRKAKKSKMDEFYTQFCDIERESRLFHLTWKRDGKAPYPICGEWGIFSLFCMSVS